MTDEKHASTRAEVSTSVPIKEGSVARGTVRIAPTVLIQLIETTVRGIHGVADLTSRKGHKPHEATTGKAFDDGKVRVVVDGDQIDADIAITLTTGSSVSKVSEKIRTEVGIAAGKMLGMHVRSVDIYVDNFVVSEP